MKTTVELPDSLFRLAKATAADEGKSLKDFFTEAVAEKLHRRGHPSARKPWESAFGGLKSLHAENRRIDRTIAREFDVIDEDEWR
jgi:hypothetical protein